MEIWDELTEQWLVHNAGSAPFTTVDLYTSHPWLTTTDDGTGLVTVQLLNTNTFWTAAMATTRKEFRVRVTLSVYNAYVADPIYPDPQTFSDYATVTDYFTVSIGHICSENVLTLVTPTPDYPDFMIPHTGTGTQAIPGHTLVSGSVTKSTGSSDCGILCDLEIWNEATNVWEVFTGS